jgi:phosphoglycerate dehydrogenase-like enzyme
VLAVTRTGREVDGAHESLSADHLDAVWPRSDVVVLAAPATPGTRHLIGAAELEALPADALLVNVARGSLVDTEALTAALAAGTIGGAALDVTDPEPLPDGHPLWREPRCLITPHAANPAAAQLPRLCRLVEENVRRFADGSPLLGVVDLDAGY